MYRLTMNSLVKLVLLSVLLITISTKTQAQTDTNATPKPDFAPKSPEAAAFLKYGEYPVDLSTGVPGISIPLYSVDIKDFKLPISLDYHASGIKVNQEATWVGLGWNLNAGAQVILSPRDEVDESNPLIDQIPDADAIIAYYKLHPYKHNDVTLLDPNLDKSRVKDMYVFSSPTVNGSFYIRNFATNDVVTIPPNAFKVDLIGADRTNMKFKITDPQGNVYTLNTTEFSDRSMSHGDRYFSAWYVDEIKTPSNNKISFTYQDDGSLTDMSFSQRVEIKKIVNKGGCPDGTTYQNQVGAVIDQGGSTVTALKKIKEIIFNDGNSKVLFTKTTGRQDLLNGSGNGYLSKIEVQQLVNGQFQNVKGYTFEYSYFNADLSGASYTDKRLKLNRVVNLFGRIEEEFVYSNVVLPNKTSKGQDYFGYYNGGANQDLIPRHYLSAPYSTEIGKADRSVNSLAIQAGILKEIHYPTKGWTKFNYENNQFFGVDIFNKYVPVIISSNVVQGTGGSVPVKEGAAPDDGVLCLNTNPADCVNYVTIPFTAINANGQLVFQMNNPVGNDPTLVKYQYAKVRVISGGTEIYNSGNIKNTVDYNISLPVLQSGTIQIEAYGQYMSIRNLQLRYVNNDPTAKNVLGAGLRIGTIENYNYDNTLVLKKQYDYSDILDISHTSGQLINDLSASFTSNNFTNYDYIQCVPLDPELIGCDGGVNSQTVYSISSNSRYGIEGNSVIYKYVKEKQIDPANQINNGYTQYEFNTAADNNVFGNAAVQISTTWKRGKVVDKKVYKTIGSANYIVEEEKNTYVEDPSNTSFYNGFKMFRLAKSNARENPQDPLYPMCPYDVDGGVDVLHTIEPVTYNLPILWYYQKASEKSSYFYNSSNALTGTVVSTTTYNYGNPSHLQLTSQTTTNSVGETLATKYFYAPDSDMASKPFVTELKAAYMIGIPLDTQTFKAGIKTAEQTTNYDKSIATNNLLLPKSVYANKGLAAIDVSLDKKITYDLYDDKGNVLQYTPESGIPVSIIWGYNRTQPIAKVENVAYATIPAATITNLQTLSNADSDNCRTGSCTEQLLRNALNTFRGTLPDAFISTYTYNPLVGVTSVTDVKGMTSYYEYDEYGRLKYVKDMNGNFLSENIYNYKN
jgi:YD repeat-containing protein